MREASKEELLERIKVLTERNRIMREACAGCGLAISRSYMACPALAVIKGDKT